MLHPDHLTRARFPFATDSELEAARYIVRQYATEVAHPCHLGHGDCAVADDGPCSGAAWAVLSQSRDSGLLDAFDLEVLP